MIADVEQLEERLSRPSPRAVETLRALNGDLVILGAGGKMGPTLARMAVRASREGDSPRRVIAVSRFSDAAVRERLEACGVETITADLLDRERVLALPDAPNVIFMAGMKFGATGNEPLTWAMNTHLPALVCERYAGSRLVALSTGNVYGMTPVSGGGSTERDPPAPVGEYAMSCLGRERIVQFFSRRDETPSALIRLNYAVELRYGVLIDLALKIRAGVPVDVSMGYVNAIWQGDACASILCALADCETGGRIVNVAGPDVLSVRELARRLAERLQRTVTFTGAESETALLSNSQATRARHGEPAVSLEQLLEWTAAWVDRGGETYDKPTHFEVRDGRF